MASLRINLLSCLTYCIAGYIGLALAIPPSNASPIWPASGVALAFILIKGNRSLPGLLIGAYLVQLYSFLDPASSQTILTSLVLGFIIASGSIIQALVARHLVEKTVGVNDPLIRDHRILRFMLFAGPVSCVISATIGALAIMVGGVIHPNDFILTWGVWWVGDTIGILIVTPILLILFAQPHEIWRSRVRTVVNPLLILLTIVMALFQYGKSQDVNRITAEFNRQVGLFQNVLTGRLSHHLDVTRSLQSLFGSTTFISEEQFNNFAGLQLEQSPDMQAMEWIIKVPNEHSEVYSREILNHTRITEPDAAGKMVMAGPRPEYFIIRYLMPYAGNQRAYGFDVASNPVARQALKFAEDSGEPGVTGPLRLVQDVGTSKIGTVIYAPVYRFGLGHSTIEDRRQNLVGFVAIVFRLEDKINLIKKKFPELLVQLNVSDDTGELYETADATGRHDLGNINLERNIDFRFANHTWHFDYTPTLEFFQQQLYWHTWWLLLGGLLLSALTGMGLLMLTGRTMRMEDQVRHRTRQLQHESSELRVLMTRQNTHNRILQAIASNASLQDILDLIVRVSEEENPGSICSILLLDEDGKHIRHGAAPNLPEEYNRAIDGLSIGMGTGCCGTAMYTRERVVVEDIETHPYWQDYQGLVRLAGVKACWSQPVIGNNQQVLGSFAIYYREIRSPGESELNRIEEMARYVSIAIERKRKELEIRKLAFFDSLTNLPNRRLLLERLEFQLAGVKRKRDYGALLFIDMDNFKMLNDSKGHQFGDKLLVQIANRIKLCIRDEDTAARLGGDEFVILIRNTHVDIARMTDQAHSLALRIKQELNQAFDLDGFIHHISPSIGINFFSHESNNPEEIIKHADTAMYTAKAQGRNRICFYHPDMQKYAEHRLQVEKDLRQAIDNRQFGLHLQPQVDSRNNLLGLEALIRWNHPDKGLVYPDEFIAIAEETGLIMPIGLWVLEEACQILQNEPRLPCIAVNISPVQLHQANFVQDLQAVIQRYQIDRDRLVLEMTERIMIQNIVETGEKLRKLRELGLGIAIDDFGTGYSSLVYLKTLPISQIKIDKAFVKDIVEDSNDRAIIESIVFMAQHFNLKLIAEGVETGQQKQMLENMGCNGYQGYLFSHPMEWKEISAKYLS